MNGHEKSDDPIVPRKPSNDPRPPGEERVEGRGSAGGNPPRPDTPGTQSPQSGVPNGLERIRRAAIRDRQAQFTALLHHVDLARLEAAFGALNPKAAPGVDGAMWRDYVDRLSENLDSLLDRIHRGVYRAKPSRRAYIDKPDGGRRPLGIAALEDKIVQRAIVEVLTPIYEVDFLGFSHGFRPGRRAHDALDGLAYAIERGKTNWVFEADIQGYFDAIPHERLMQFLEHRIGDPRVLRLIRRWLKAGVLEEDEWRPTETGSPQGASISPLLANIYLHYVFDAWAHEWRRANARGEVYIVRYADDFVVCFQYREEAERFHAELQERFLEHGLALHPEKTRLIEFGRFAAENRKERGEGKPATFDFLGFTHICGRTLNGRSFRLLRHTIARRFGRTLKRIRERLIRTRHMPVAVVGAWLRRVVNGWDQYHAVPTNMWRVGCLRQEIAKAWLFALRRRSQHDRTNWSNLQPLLAHWLPKPRILHPWPHHRMHARLTTRKSRMR